MRLDLYLQSYLKKEYQVDISRSFVEKILQAGIVKVQGEVVKKKSFEFKPEKHQLIIEEEELKPYFNYYFKGKLIAKEAKQWDKSATLDQINPDNLKEILNDVQALDKQAIVFEDDNLAVVYKPADLVVHPGIGHHDDCLIYRYLKLKGQVARDLPRVGLINRLDKETQGLVMMAKNLNTYNKIRALFKKHQVFKLYVAIINFNDKFLKNLQRGIKSKEIDPIYSGRLVEDLGRVVKQEFGANNNKNWKKVSDYRSLQIGTFLKELKASGYEWDIKGRIRRSRQRREMMVFSSKGVGQSARSKFFPLWIDREKKQGIILVNLITGRTHQIRSQLRYLGGVVINDNLYTPRGISKRGNNTAIELDFKSYFEDLGLDKALLEAEKPLFGLISWILGFEYNSREYILIKGDGVE